MRRRTILIIGAASVTTGFTWLERWAAPASRLVDAHWTQSGSGSSVDHGPWAAFLQRFVTADDAGVNRVRYDQVGPADRAALDAYIADLAATDVTALARAEQLALWINLYNALTVRTVLDHPGVDSIREITFGRSGASGPWGEPLVTVEDRDLSLDDIEHGIIRPVFDEPRIHYAVNCAAVGCPNLQMTPFTAAGLDDQLDQAARSYVNDPRGVALTVGGDVELSSIYNWFRADFGGSETAVLGHLQAFAEPGLRERLAGASIDSYTYDWALNGA
ncbi:MAG: DUF547 domain-containing protein [Pseudomonadota bacterium]